MSLTVKSVNNKNILRGGFFRIFLYFLIIISSFYFASDIYAGNTCQRLTDKIIITIRIAYYQVELPGGAAAIPKDDFDNAIESVYNGFKTTACGLPVEFVVESKIDPRPYVLNDWDATPGIQDGDREEAYRYNGPKCTTANSGYHCILIYPDQLIIYGKPIRGRVVSLTLDPLPSDNTYGWWAVNGYSRTAPHETGHLLRLSDEYDVNTLLGTANIMGRGTAAEQKHIDQIVKSICSNDVTNFVCEDNVSPSYAPAGKCCVIGGGSSRFWGGSMICDFDKVNICPLNTCTNAKFGTSCSSECSCGTDTCVPAGGKCEPAPTSGKCEDISVNKIASPGLCSSGNICCKDLTDTCTSATQDCLDPGSPAKDCVGLGTTAGTGTCAGGKICCIKTSVPPTTPPSTPPGTPPPTPCTDVLCSMSCIDDGSCTPCQLLQVALNFGKLILEIIGGICLLFVVWGGFVILTAAGLGQKIEQGRGIIINSLIGLSIAFCAYVLVIVAVWIATGETSVFTGSLVC